MKNVPRKTEYVSVNITIFPFTMTTEAVAQRSSVKKVFLEISEIHRKTPVPVVCLLKTVCVFL